MRDAFFFLVFNIANALASLSINDDLQVGLQTWKSALGGSLHGNVKSLSQQSDPAYSLHTEHWWWTCTHTLNTLITKAQYDNAWTSFSALNKTRTHTSTSRTGPLHDCPWLWVNKPCPKPQPHTLPLPAARFPIGQLVVSILLCLCFHKHGAQTTVNFPLQASTNTLLPLYCPEASILSLFTIKSLYQQSGSHQVFQVKTIGSLPNSH